MAFPIVFLAAAAAANARSRAGAVMPAAAQLFERDWVLMNWALKFTTATATSCLSRAKPRPRRANSARSPTATATGA